MALPKALQKNPAVTAVISIAVLAMAVTFIAMRADRVERIGSDQSFYFDLGNGKLFTAPATVPPIAAPDGGAGMGVRAVVVSCGACGEADQKIAYLQKMSDEAHRAMATNPSTPDEQMQVAMVVEQGRLVAQAPEAGETPQWVMETGEAGQRIIDAGLHSCHQGQAKQCYP